MHTQKYQGHDKTNKNIKWKGHFNLVVVIFLFLAWFCIMVQVSLSKKLPLSVNILLFMAIDAILTNKLTISAFNLKLFKINTNSIPHFLSMILHNDFTVTFVLLTFANVFLTTTKSNIRWGISIYTFLFQIFIGAMLRWNQVLTDKGWNFFMESIMIVIVMTYTILLGRLFQRMASKEGWIR